MNPLGPELEKFEFTDADRDLLDYRDRETEEKIDKDELCSVEEDLEAENEYLIETKNTKNKLAEIENKELSIKDWFVSPLYLVSLNLKPNAKYLISQNLMRHSQI